MINIENIISVVHSENSIGLSLVITDLDNKITYNNMRIRIDEYDWVYVNQDLNNSNRSKKAVFFNLNLSNLYQSYGEVQVNDEWVSIHSPKFQPQNKYQASSRILSRRHVGLSDSPMSKVGIL